jgi:hypothetical protein
MMLSSSFFYYVSLGESICKIFFKDNQCSLQNTHQKIPNRMTGVGKKKFPSTWAQGNYCPLLKIETTTDKALWYMNGVLLVLLSKTF